MNQFIFKGLPALAILFLIAAFLMGLAARNSYVDEIAGQNAELLPVRQSHEGYAPSKALQDELLQADLIARVVFEGSRAIEHQATRSTVSIVEVIHGEGIQRGDKIDLYEAVFLTLGPEGKPVYDNYSLFNWMLEGQEYVIFANRKKFHPSYEETLERQVFVPVNWEISLFRMEFTMPPIFSAQEIAAGRVSYGDVKKDEFICVTEEQRAAVNQFKENLFAAIGIHQEKDIA